MWSMIETHILLQSSGLNFGKPSHLMLSFVVSITPKLVVRLRDNTQHWNRLLDIYWMSSLYLKHSGVTYNVMLSLLLAQLLLRV